MSSENTPQIDSLQEQVRGIEQDAEALAKAMASSRTVRRFLLLAIVALVCVIGFMFYGLGAKLQSKETQQEIVDLSLEQLEKRSGLLLAELKTLADNSRPALQEAFEKQAKQDAGEYLVAIQRERDVFANEMAEEIGQKLVTEQEKTEARFRMILKEEFTLSEDPVVQERLMTNVENSLKKMVKKHFVDEIKAQLNRLYATWDNFPPAEPAAKGDPPLEDQVVGLLVELLKVKLTSNEQPQPLES